MRIAVAVLLLFIAYVTCYPSLREISSDDDESDKDLELELRSILNSLNDEQESDEQMTRSLTSEDDDDDSYSFNKRQGGHNIVNKETKCEIECVHAERFPAAGKGKGKTIKEAAKACKNKCVIGGMKRGGKKSDTKKSPKRVNKMNLREFVDDDDSNTSSEEQQNQRREFYDYVMQQIQRNNNE